MLVESQVAPSDWDGLTFSKEDMLVDRMLEMKQAEDEYYEMIMELEREEEENGK